ncbi:winged helix-turn-helix transcriptional regulator [Candidatus Woesearchaeota archaeon]|nr:winged helix-turn-helix transcriptional regulator [Candidatus Woesearchaeota archaeon]
MVKMAYPEEGSVLLQLFGDSPKLRLLNVFLENSYFDFTREELVKELGMSKLTVYKYVKQMLNFGIIKVSRKIGKAVLYRLDRKNPDVSLIEDFLKQFSLNVADKELRKKRIIVTS